MHELLEKFANSTVLSTNIKVEKTEHSTHFMPRDGKDGMFYEECVLLSNILQGAEHFLWWLRRNNYRIIATPKGYKRHKKD
jgi:hypothetical protein